jgi:hypothetical protein
MLLLLLLKSAAPSACYRASYVNVCLVAVARPFVSSCSCCCSFSTICLHLKNDIVIKYTPVCILLQLPVTVDSSLLVDIQSRMAQADDEGLPRDDPLRKMMINEYYVATGPAKVNRGGRGGWESEEGGGEG